MKYIFNFEGSLYSNTVKYFRIAIQYFLPKIQELTDLIPSPEISERLSDLKEFYQETAHKIDKFNLNLSDPNRTYDGEPHEIPFSSLGIDTEKKLKNLVALTLRLLLEWKVKIQKLETKDILTEKMRDEIYVLRKQIETLDIFFNDSQFVLFKFKSNGPLKFPGEETPEQISQQSNENTIMIFPEKIINKLPADLKKVCDEFNYVFGKEKPIAGMLLLRRLLPLTIVRYFNKENKEREIKTNNEYLDTKALLDKVEPYIENKRVQRDILRYKLLIDSSQHSYSISIQQEDVLGAGVTMRAFLEQLF